MLDCDVQLSGFWLQETGFDYKLYSLAFCCRKMALTAKHSSLAFCLTVTCSCLASGCRKLAMTGNYTSLASGCRKLVLTVSYTFLALGCKLALTVNYISLAFVCRKLVKGHLPGAASVLAQLVPCAQPEVERRSTSTSCLPVCSEALACACRKLVVATCLVLQVCWHSWCLVHSQKWRARQWLKALWLGC